MTATPVSVLISELELTLFKFLEDVARKIEGENLAMEPEPGTL